MSLHGLVEARSLRPTHRATKSGGAKLERKVAVGGLLRTFVGRCCKIDNNEDRRDMNLDLRAFCPYTVSEAVMNQ